ncbi:MAG: hypothetical protein ACRYFK_11810 [Janthinobacterium lividum]
MITIDHFCTLAPAHQAAYTLAKGRQLAWQALGTNRRSLYYLLDEGRGFFVELLDSPKVGQSLVLRASASTDILAGYTTLART